MLRKLCMVIALILVSNLKAVDATDDFQYWSQYSLKFYKSQKFDGVIFADSRVTHDAEK